MRTRSRLVLVAIAVLIALASAGAQESLEQRASALFANARQGLAPGAAVVVIRDGKVIFQKGYGYADLEHRIPMTTTAVFDVASVSKQFTGLAVSMLVDQGKIGLTDDIRKYLPEMHAFEPPITIDHLLHHTSGLRDWPGMLEMAGWNFSDLISFEHILRFAYAQKTRNFISGDEHTYSNTNYNLLAEIVARVTGKSFRAWTDENLFAPLGMTATHFRVDVGEVFPNRVWSYRQTSDRNWAVVSNGLLAQGSSSLFTTADDLAKWLMNFSTRRVGGDAGVDRMLMHTKLNDGTPVKYALGVTVDDWRGHRRISHGGGWAGFSTFGAWFPAIRSGVVMLSNTPVNPEVLTNSLAEIFLGDRLGPTSAMQSAPGEARVAQVSTTMLDEYAGRYKLGPAWYVRIRRDGNELKTQATQESETAMIALSQTEFRVPGYGNRTMTFVRDGEGRISSLRYQGTPRRSAPRVDAVERPLNVNDYPGEYENDELSARYTVTVRDGTLVVSNFRRGSSPLTRAFGDEFRTPIFSIQFERDPDGRVIGFLADAGERNRNIRFIRR